MFLFILESIGTSELILIAAVALIVFGPRKLPQMAKTIAKTMAEFRSATNEFKSTWEKEVAFEDDEKKAFTLPDAGNQIARNTNENIADDSVVDNASVFASPTIKELSASEIAEKFHNGNGTAQPPAVEEKNIEKAASDKRDWL